MSNSENRRAIEVLTNAFEQIAERARQQRWPAEVVADAAFRASLSLVMAQTGIRGAGEMCRRLGDELQRFANVVDGYSGSASV